MEKKFKEAMEHIDSVSTTADVWTAHKCSYFGMTVHWIDPVSLIAVKLLFVAPGLLADIRMMFWLLKLSTFIVYMVSMGR